MKTFILMLCFALPVLNTFAQMNLFQKPDRSKDGDDMFGIALDAVYTDDLAMYNYEHLFPLGIATAMGGKIGVLMGDSYLLVTELSFVAPGPRHFAELGVGALINTHSNAEFNFFDSSILGSLDDDFYFTLRAGYRFQAEGGFLFKAGGMYAPGSFFVPLIGLGYVF